MRVGICDDNFLHLNQIYKSVKTLLDASDYNDSIDIKKYLKPTALLADHEQFSFDVVFLDVDMPDIDGFLVGDLIYETNADCIIIYVTSHGHYAKSSIKHHVFRFVDKGCQTDFEDAVSALVRDYTTLHRTISFFEPGTPHEFDLSKILYFTAGHTYADVHYADGQTYKSTMTMTQIEHGLADNWVCRVNRSTIINFHCVYTIDWSKHVFIMTDQARISVSKKYYPHAKLMFAEFVGRNINL